MNTLQSWVGSVSRSYDTYVRLPGDGAAQQAAGQRVQHDEHVAELRGQRVALVRPPVLAPHHVHLVVAQVPRLEIFLRELVITWH